MVRLFSTTKILDKILYVEQGWLYLCGEDSKATRFTLFSYLPEDKIIEQLTSNNMYIEEDIDNLEQKFKEEFVKAIFND